MILKLCLKHQAPVNGALQSLYNHDPRMTLTYLMARSAEVAYPRSQVSVYRTIGPLVWKLLQPETWNLADADNL